MFGRLKLEFNSHFIPITGKQDDLVADNNFLDLVSLPEKGVGRRYIKETVVEINCKSACAPTIGNRDTWRRAKKSHFFDYN